MANRSDREQATYVRDLGLYERVLYVVNKEYGVHFLAVAEFDVRLDVESVASALAALVDRHPLLSVCVEERPDGPWVFHRLPGAQGPRLLVVDDLDATWQREAERELHDPFDSRVAPLVRLTLVRRASYSALLLCLDHTISDGISSMSLLNDLIAGMNGHVLEPLALQQSADTLLAVTSGSVEPLNLAELEVDPRMLAPLRTASADGAPETLSTAAMTSVGTALFAQRCRAEATTVHAAILVAVSQIRATDLGLAFIRCLSPINIRSMLGVGDDCGLFISAAVTGADVSDPAPFWEQARGLTAQLTVARSPAAVRTTRSAMDAAMSLDTARAETVERLQTSLPTEMCVTNLGVKDIVDSGPIRPVAVWAPIVRSVGASECIIGVLTHGGQLRMVACGIGLSPDFLERVAANLIAAAQS